jgi:hypothetical protein
MRRHNQHCQRLNWPYPQEGPEKQRFLNAAQVIGRQVDELPCTVSALLAGVV